MVARSARGDGRRRRRAFLAAAVVAVLGIGSGVALARTGSSAPAYRLAVARTGDVQQQLVSVGTVSAAHRATVSFPVSGTVDSVLTTVGAKVTAGDVLATLSTTALNQQVATAQAALAAAQQSLAADEAGQSGATTATLSTASTPGIDAVLTSAITVTKSVTSGGSGRAEATGAGGVAGAASTVATAQHRLARARATLDRDLAAAEIALQTCAAELAQGSGSPTASASATASASPSTSANPTASASPRTSASPTASASPNASASTHPSAGGPVAGCLAAIGRAPSKAQISSDRTAVAAADASLNAAIGTLTAAARSATSSAGAGNGSGTSVGSAGGTGGGRQPSNQQAGSQQPGSQQGGRGSGTTGPASAEQLAADRAQIDAAEANLVLARRNLAAAVLVSPITGTVAAVTIQRGQAVSATSSSSTITVIGPGQEQVSTSVSLADVETVKLGDPATVTVDGVATPLSGRVSSIGLLNTTTGGSTSYPVTVLLVPTTARLFDGSGASVTIQVAEVRDALTVPSSAVHNTGRLSTVTVVRNGKAASTRVTLGVVGSDRTEIRSGLSAGDQVVLADLGTPLPSSDSTTNRRLPSGFAGGGGTFGGATFGGGTGRPGG